MKSRTEVLLTDIKKLIETLPDGQAKVGFQKQADNAERVLKLAESDKRANIRADVSHLNNQVDPVMRQMLKELSDDVIKEKNAPTQSIQANQTSVKAQEQSSTEGQRPGGDRRAARGRAPAPQSAVVPSPPPVAVDPAKVAAAAKEKAAAIAAAQAQAAESAKGAVTAQAKSKVTNAAAKASAPASAQELLEKVDAMIDKLPQGQAKERLQQEFKSIERLMIMAESDKKQNIMADKSSMMADNFGRSQNLKIDALVMSGIKGLEKEVQQAMPLERSPIRIGVGREKPNTIKVSVIGLEKYLNQKGGGVPVLFTDNDSKVATFDKNDRMTITQTKTGSLAGITASTTQVAAQPGNTSELKYSDKISVELKINKMDPHLLQGFASELKKIGRDQVGTNVIIESGPRELVSDLKGALDKLGVKNRVKMVGLKAELRNPQEPSNKGPGGFAGRVMEARRASKAAVAQVDTEKVDRSPSVTRK
jgi:hypothetical protein